MKKLSWNEWKNLVEMNKKTWLKWMKKLGWNEWKNLVKMNEKTSLRSVLKGKLIARINTGETGRGGRVVQVAV